MTETVGRIERESPFAHGDHATRDVRQRLVLARHLRRRHRRAVADRLDADAELRRSGDSTTKGEAAISPRAMPNDELPRLQVFLRVVLVEADGCAADVDAGGDEPTGHDRLLHALVIAPAERDPRWDADQRPDLVRRSGIRFAARGRGDDG